MVRAVDSEYTELQLMHSRIYEILPISLKQQKVAQKGKVVPFSSHDVYIFVSFCDGLMIHLQEESQSESIIKVEHRNS